jgi:hypothetical protein
LENKENKQKTPYVIPGSEWQVLHKNLSDHLQRPISTLDSITTKRRLDGELQSQQIIHLAPAEYKLK